MKPDKWELPSNFLRILDEDYGQIGWKPSADVYRGRDRWLVKFDVAGVQPVDVSITFERNVLKVSGVRRDWSILEDQQSYSMEICYNQFERSIRLPIDVEGIESARIETDFRDGMLLVSVLPQGEHD